MTLQQFIELVINDSIDNTRDSSHLSYPIIINNIELDFGDISVSHLGAINIFLKESGE